MHFHFTENNHGAIDCLSCHVTEITDEYWILYSKKIAFPKPLLYNIAVLQVKLFNLCADKKTLGASL